MLGTEQKKKIQYSNCNLTFSNMQTLDEHSQIHILLIFKEYILKKGLLLKQHIKNQFV